MIREYTTCRIDVLKTCRLSFMIALSLVLMLAPMPLIHAQIGSCAVSLSPNVVEPHSDASFNFGLYTTDGSPVNWIQITRPSGQYVTLESGSASGWQSTLTSDAVTFSGGNLPGGYSLGATVQAQTADATSGPISWQVQASDSTDGSNPTICNGDTSFTIVHQVTPVTISNVAAADISSNSAMITWTTDIAATSMVNYGLDSSYGNNTSQDNTLVTDHRVTLSGLNANTGYHFQAVSTTPDGGSATSSDNTFLTLHPPSSIPPVSSPTPNPSDAAKPQPVTLVSPLAVKVTNAADKTPPTISLTIPSNKTFKSPPTLSGSASDNISVQRVEYSTDGGKDWLPVDTAPGLKTAKTTFSFTPLNTDDGTYAVLARAIDAGGNTTLTAVFMMVIDRIPPIVGGNVMSIGTQLLAADQTGAVTVPASVNVKITLSSVGGPTGLIITAIKTSGSLKPLHFFLSRSDSTGLWQGIMSFERAGMYDMSVQAVDGAGNQTSRPIGTVTVRPAGLITDAHTSKPLDANLTIYSRDPDTNSWVKWDSATYGQPNPAHLAQGVYSLFLPPGLYYLKFTANGHQTVVSQSFTLHTATILADNLTMQPSGLRLGSLHFIWPTLTQSRISITGQSTTSKNSVPVSIGKTLPNVSLPSTTGQMLKSTDLLGRPSIVTMLSTWAPPARDQLEILNRLDRTELNVIPIGLGEDAARLGVYGQIAGYTLPLFADVDQALAAPLGVVTLPTHYFVDRHGVVKKVVVGVLSTEELLANVQY